MDILIVLAATSRRYSDATMRFSTSGKPRCHFGVDPEMSVGLSPQPRRLSCISTLPSSSLWSPHERREYPSCSEDHCIKAVGDRHRLPKNANRLMENPDSEADCPLMAELRLHSLRAAILASNARNAQPWLLFKVSDSWRVLSCTPTPGVNLGPPDPLPAWRCHLSLGCALENLVIAAAPNGYQKHCHDISLRILRAFPDQWQSRPVAMVELAVSRQSTGELYRAIPKSPSTNRGLYDPAKFPQLCIRELHWKTSRPTMKQEFISLHSKQARERITDLTR